MKASNLLGLNARSQLYTYQYNSHRAKNLANSKVQTARLLLRAKIPHPQLLVKFADESDLDRFDFTRLPAAFVVKPSRGLGGEGIIVVKKRSIQKERWVTSGKKIIGIEDLKLHIRDVLEGAYSMGNVPDVAIIQEYVACHKLLAKYSFRGTPDIRIIVFNQVPVMAMLRLPTRESGGRANLHQGAIAVGVDLATGITTYAYHHQKYIKYKPAANPDLPETKRKLHGIRIPYWERILEVALGAAKASGLGYLGVDVVLHPIKGPMVLELNAQPGLQIQLANKAGLKKRLERVEGLEVRGIEHGIKIAKALFGTNFGGKIIREKGDITQIGVWEKVKLLDASSRRHEVQAKVDTGAWRSSIDKDLAEKLGLITKNNILWTRKVRSSLGVEERPVIYLRYYLSGRFIRSFASVANREHLKAPFLIGRHDLSGFMVFNK